jgi:hypothetical protein
MFNYLLYFIKKIIRKPICIDLTLDDLIDLNYLENKIYFGLEENVSYYGVVILTKYGEPYHIGKLGIRPRKVEQFCFHINNNADTLSSDIEDIRELI